MELRDFCKHSFAQCMFTCIIFAPTCYLGCLYSFREDVKEPCVWLPRAVEVSAVSLASPRWTQDIFLAVCYSGHLGHLLLFFFRSHCFHRTSFTFLLSCKITIKTQTAPERKKCLIITALFSVFILLQFLSIRVWVHVYKCVLAL